MAGSNNTSHHQGADFSAILQVRLPPPSPQNIAWSVCLGLVGLVTLVANSLTIATFSQKRLRKPPHYLLISLACADIMVGSISIPIYTCVMLKAVEITIKTRALIWFFDFLSAMASIYTLAAVSLERLFAIGWPLRHRVTSSLTYFALVAIPWILAITVASLPLFDMFQLLPQGAMPIVLTASYCFPIVLTTLTYITLWFKLRQSRISVAEQRREKDKRLAITLIIATVVFVLTWLPFPIILSIVNFCFTCVSVDMLSSLSSVSKFLHLSNSFMNSLIYILRIPEFRVAIGNLVCRKRAVTRIGEIPLNHVSSNSKSSEKTSMTCSQGNADLNLNTTVPLPEAEG